MSDEEEKPEASPPPPPPPPEEPKNYEAEGYSSEIDRAEEEHIAESSGPAVASSANKNLILMLVGGVLGIFLLYQIFSGGDEEEVSAPVPTSGSGSGGAPVANEAEITLDVPTFDPLPPLPPIAPPEQPQVNELPVPPPPPTTPDIDFVGDGPNNEQLEERRKSEMLILSGGDNSSEEEDGQAEQESAAPRAVATQVGDLDQLILQGKIIHAVLETAIDTTLQGPLRALVTRDIYAESGYGVLIPKGSRLIGTYSTDIVRGQGRVYIIWSRVIRPDGVDIQLGDAMGIDRLGRAGMTGHVDERYFEIFGGAILTSILGIAVAGAADAILDPPQTTTTQTPEGNSNVQGSAVDTAITDSVENIGTAATQIAGGLLDARPNITVDQGTPIKIYVNQDLEFPDMSAKNEIRIIQ